MMNSSNNSALLNNSSDIANNLTITSTQNSGSMQWLHSITMQNILDFVEIVTLIFLIIYVIKTWHIASATKEATIVSERTLHEMKETREQEIAPYIVVYCDVPIPYDTIMYLIVKNIGKSIAEDVKIEFSPNLCTAIKYGKDFNINDMTFIKDGIKSMPPGYTIKTILDDSINYFSGEHDFPLKYEVKISYINSLNKKQIETSQIIDLLSLKDLKYVRKYDLNDLVKEMKDANKKS